MLESYCTAACFSYANYAGFMLQSCCIAIRSPYCNHTGTMLHQLCKLSCFHAASILLSFWNQQHDSIKYIPVSLAAYMLQSCCNTVYTEFILGVIVLEILPLFQTCLAPLSPTLPCRCVCVGGFINDWCIKYMYSNSKTHWSSGIIYPNLVSFMK